jgi:deoxyadenosine/deoxycytidine kinase
VNRDEHEVAIVNPPEAGFEEVHEGKTKESKLDPRDPHGPQTTLDGRASAILRGILDFGYLAIEGPVGAGKAALAERFAAKLDGTVVLDTTENPFLADFYAGRPGAAFQTQLFFTLARHRQQVALRQADLFSQLTICDYLFDRDRIHAYLNLDDNELFIYQRLYDLLSRDVPAPDLVLYLQTPTDVLRRRLRERARHRPDERPLGDDYIRELNEAYNHFFFHYTATPLLVIETSHLDLSWGEDTVDDLIRQLRGMGQGTRYYVPRIQT